MKPIRCAIAFALLALSSRRHSREDAYPSHPIRLVVGFGAGGPTDIPARYVADKLGTALGQRMIVENKPAAAGMLATRDVLGQPADGYTLLFCTHFELINTAVYKNPGFKLADLAPISLVAKYYYGIALSNSIPAENFEQFVQYAKAHPGEVTYATIGAGSAQEIMARQLEKIAGISMNRIPFRGGRRWCRRWWRAGSTSTPRRPSRWCRSISDKQLKLLATTSPSRIPSLPEVPTLKDKGIDYVRFGWLGFCAPKGTPQPIIDRLNKEIGTIVQTPEYRDLIEKGGSLPESSTPEQLRQIITQTVTDVEGTIKEFGLQQE